MIAPPEDRNLYPLETHQHSPSCAPMAASLERIAKELHTLVTIAGVVAITAAFAFIGSVLYLEWK